MRMLDHAFSLYIRVDVMKCFEAREALLACAANDSMSLAGTGASSNDWRSVLRTVLDGTSVQAEEVFRGHAAPVT